MVDFLLACEESCVKTRPTKFCFEELQAATDFFSRKNLLGMGGFGSVFKGVLENGEAIGIKKLHDKSSLGDSEFRNEFELLQKVDHPNVIKLVGYCDDGSERLLIYEFMQLGTLRDNLHGFSWLQRMHVAASTAGALKYLHEMRPPIVHRDFKSANLLFDEVYNCRLSDFDSSFEYHGYWKTSKGMVGTMGYIDPDYLFYKRATPKSDVYSFGVVLLELITGERAYHCEEGCLVDRVICLKTK